jgi:hypothetical protein
VAEASALRGGGQGFWGEGSAIKIVRHRPISSARAAHSSEGEIVKEKAYCSIVERGKHYGKTVEITGTDCTCKICDGKITMQSGRPFCEDCGAILGSDVYKEERKPEQKPWRGGGAFMRALIHH